VQIPSGIPDDVAVLGFDDLPLSQYTEPGLSTVRQPVDIMAARMVREMLAQVTTPGQGLTHVVLDTALILCDPARPVAPPGPPIRCPGAPERLAGFRARWHRTFPGGALG
jgi:hypothetical protein